MWGRYPKRRAARGGIQALSKRGAFGATWWGRRWMESLEEMGHESRLARGRSYARAGQVLTLDLEPGRVRARVQGSSYEPYDVTLKLSPLTNAEWERLYSALESEPGLLATLLSGELPPALDSVLLRARVPLFPRMHHDLEGGCDCYDGETPCKHLAAVCCLLAEELDRDPFGLFLLRGKTREEFLASLLDAGGQSAAAAPVEPLPTDPTAFWRGLPESLPSLGPVRRPALAAPVVRRLGPFPLWRYPTPLESALSPALEAAAERVR